MILVKSKHLFIADSALPGAGKGLFTRILIGKGAFIVEYRGRVTNWAAVRHDIDNDYLYYVNDLHVINAKPYKKALARYANDAEGPVKVRGVFNNCVYQKEARKIYIKAICDIPAGAEVFVRYGKDYWAQDQKNKAYEAFNRDR